MKVLLVHQNFPGQFKFLAPALVARGHQVLALNMRNMAPTDWMGVKVVPYASSRVSTPDVHPWVVDFETKTIRSEACFRAALNLKAAGFSPDVIVAHPGWGESLFLKEVWPAAKLGIYCEFFYHHQGADVNFDPEFPDDDPGSMCKLRLKNVNNLLHFEIADSGLSPTRWQASTYPAGFRERITVAHDGIDTAALTTNPSAHITITKASGEKLSLSREDEVITFVSRNLEPYRGYHVFMRTLPALLQRRPHARVLVVGGDESGYGPPPKQGGSWKDVLIREVRPAISDADWSRVHFVGKLPYADFCTMMQVSTVHVYLTYPFVLSWSLLEAMSMECAIVASDTLPVREVIQHDETGRLVGFFDRDAMVDSVCELLEDPAARARLGARAREVARARFDLQTVCLPQQVQWVESLAG